MKSNLNKKALSIILTLAMIFTLFAGLTIPASASASFLDPFVPITLAVPYVGQTTQGDYTIQTATQLMELAKKVNTGTSYLGSTFELLNNIDLAVSDSYPPITDRKSTRLNSSH